MKTRLFLPIFAALSIFAASCTKELKYTKEELFAMTKAADPSMTLILPRNMNEGVRCSDYTPPCLAGHTVKVKNLDVLALEYMTEEEAMNSARKIKGYYVRNWAFDDVTGEPILERFVEEALQAKKP